MIKFMLDTNIVIYVLKQRPVSALSTFNKHRNQMCISAITLAELIHGAEKSQKTEQNLAAIEDFVSRLEVLNYGPEAAAHYGDIRAELEKAGSVIGVNDLHIAGHARANGLVVVTNNEREFARVAGLRTENWV
ncbi:MAG: tRNA(fMet)-specific endonuclease VapC [Pseudohongiella sp.]|uniref:type II toxin-antitoxin system tRNA(fMet)-specific endonuclease VapC n=1 Tax=Pseudohongiella sp. TaxID=1979412 RepID=UPI00349FD519